MEFAFHFHNTMAGTGIMMALRKSLSAQEAPPVILCIGSDLAVGDSLGPLAGTLLCGMPFEGFIYGTLRTPVTAKEVRYLEGFLRKTHPRSKIVAIDAAVGDESEVGLVKLSDLPLRPGAGANKRLGSIGDISILGIIAKKSAFSYAQLNLTRLNTVFTMADMIASAVANFLSDRADQRRLFERSAR